MLSDADWLVVPGGVALAPKWADLTAGEFASKQPGRNPVRDPHAEEILSHAVTIQQGASHR